MTVTRGLWWAWRRLRWEEPKRRAGGIPTASIGTLYGAVFDAVHPSFVKRP